MSHATGIVKTEDGEYRFFEYNGTSDRCCTRIHMTMEGVRNNWRGDNMAECTCLDDDHHIECQLATNYGGGYYFDGKICIMCEAIVETHDFNGEEHHGHPDTEVEGFPYWWDEAVQTQI